MNLVVIAIHSAKRFKGKIIDETRRYSEYFPKQAIGFFDKGFKKINDLGFGVFIFIRGVCQLINVDNKKFFSD